jgi:hypothetical protein
MKIRKIIRFTFYFPCAIFTTSTVYFPRRGAGDRAKERLVPHVTDDTDILEQTATAYERDEVLPLPLVLPSSRRGRSRLLAALRGWFTADQKKLAQQVPQNTVAVRKFELPIDIMANKYPDLYIRLMTGVG